MSARRTTPPARVSVETGAPAVAPGELRQLSLHSPIRTRASNVHPLPNTIGVRRGRVASGERFSPRPTSRPRQRPSSPTALGLAIVPPSARSWRQISTLAWVQARVIVRLQLRASSGAQQGRDQAPTTDGRRLSEVSLPMERTRRTTPPVTVSVGTRVLAVAPREPQQPTSGWPMPTGDMNISPLPKTIGVRRCRAASGDRPWPRPSLRSRQRPPSPAAGGLTTTPPPVGRGWHTITPAFVASRVLGEAPASSIE